MYVNGFVCPESGDNFWLLLPSVTLEIFTIAIDEFVSFYKISKDNRAIIVIDGAGFHQEENLTLPEGIHLIFLPPYSPELQPAEKLWPLSNEGIANLQFDTLNQLERKQAERCQQLFRMKDYVKGVCLFSWWPRLQTNGKK